MKVTVKVDKKRCIGSASCVVIASEHFALNSEGKAEVKAAKKTKPQGMELTFEIDAKGRKKLLEAAQVCPTQAITIIDVKE